MFQEVLYKYIHDVFRRGMDTGPYDTTSLAQYPAIQPPSPHAHRGFGFVTADLGESVSVPRDDRGQNMMVQQEDIDVEQGDPRRRRKNATKPASAIDVEGETFSAEKEGANTGCDQ